MYIVYIRITIQVGVLSYIPAYYFDEVSKFTFCGIEKCAFSRQTELLVCECKDTTFSLYGGDLFDFFFSM